MFESRNSDRIKLIDFNLGLYVHRETVSGSHTTDNTNGETGGDPFPNGVPGTRVYFPNYIMRCRTGCKKMYEGEIKAINAEPERGGWVDDTSELEKKQLAKHRILS